MSCPAALVLLALSKATNPHDPLLAAGPRLSVVLQLKDALRTSGLLHHVAEVAVVAAKELSAVRAEQHSGAGGGSRGAGSGRGGGGLVEDSGGSLTSSDAEDRDSRVPWDNGAEPRGDVLLDLIGAGEACWGPALPLRWWPPCISPPPPAILHGQTAVTRRPRSGR